MRRTDQRRLEAALGRLAPKYGDTLTDASSVVDLLRELEAAAAEIGDRAEQADLLASRLGAALDILTSGVVICDEHGDEVYRNVAANSLGGARLGEVLADQAISELLEEARRGNFVERSLELFSPVRRNLTIRAFPIARSGPLGAVAVVEDVSERHRIDAIRRDFVANVSHELKTPVGALCLLAEILDGEDDLEQVGRLSARVAMEAERLGRIIDDLLDLSRIEGNEHPRYDRVSVHSVIAEAVDPLRPVADAQEIKLDVDEPSPSAVVIGDRRDLVSAVSNLVDNAIKYSERGSLVTVRAAVEGEVTQIAVSDEGIGIPARDRERIFERFYRVDRARSRLTGGTGLGLSIVRHIAANHGGDVRVESEEGKGSTFTLVLPAREVSEGREAGDG